MYHEKYIHDIFPSSIVFIMPLNYYLDINPSPLLSYLSINLLYYSSLTLLPNFDLNSSTLIKPSPLMSKQSKATSMFCYDIATSMLEAATRN